MVTVDLIASCTFNLPPLVAAKVLGLAKEGGRDVKAQDGNEKTVPKAALQFLKRDDSLRTGTGWQLRFVARRV